jgi:hypothetical protein
MPRHRVLVMKTPDGKAAIVAYRCKFYPFFVLGFVISDAAGRNRNSEAFVFIYNGSYLTILIIVTFLQVDREI